MYINKQSNIQKKDLVSTKTASGNPVVISDCAGGKARSLITSINAIQDLHGYDKPWAGGADRNLLPDSYTAQSASVFGLTVTKVDNGLRFVGTPNWNTQTSQFRAASSSDIATLYADGASSACFLKASNQYINIDSCRVDGNDIIVVANTIATTASIDFTLEFMMYKGTAPTAFRPYSNICPISGRTEARVDDVGKNLTEDKISGCNLMSNGGIITDSTFDMQIAKVKQGETYVITTDDTSGAVYGFFTSKPVQGSTSYNGTRYVTTVKTFTAPITGYVAYRTFANYATPQCEIGTTPTPYEPYAHSSATIQLGQTVYGADINWDTGVMMIKTALVDLGTLAYTQNGTAQSGKYRYSATVTGIKPNTQAGVTPNIKSSQYKAETPNDSYSAVDGITVVNSDIYIYDSTKNTMSVDDFKTAMDGVTAEYELAAPTTIQLTPTQLEMLKGYNRVTIDNGSIEIEYIPDNLAGDILSIVEEDYVKLEDVNTDPISVSGNPIVIQDAAAIKARSLKTTINAIQDLHGLPFPYVGGAYKNKLPLTVSGLKAINTDGTWSGNIYTFNGATAEILTDAANNVTGIKVNGTPSLAFTFYLTVGFTSTDYPNQMKVNGAYGVENNNAFIRVQELNTWTVLADDTGASADGVAFTATSIPSQAIIRVYQGTTVTNAVFYPMFRLATESDASFAPYSNICPISGRTAVVVNRSDGDEISEDFTIQLGTTVYGADINWDTGVASVLRRAYDMGELNYEYLSDNNAFRSTSALPDATTENVFINSISSIYKEHQTGMANMTDGEFRVQGGIIYLKDFRFTSASDLKTALSGQTVVYDIATPSTIQLTPTQLEMLKGYNRVTLADGYGTIELSYQKDNIAGDIASLTENELSIKADNSDISSNFELGSTASKAYSTNQFMLREDGLYKVTSSIASGAEITSSNTTKVTITEVLTALLNA